jgi:hypothetical protein
VSTVGGDAKAWLSPSSSSTGVEALQAGILKPETAITVKTCALPPYRGNMELVRIFLTQRNAVGHMMIAKNSQRTVGSASREGKLRTLDPVESFLKGCENMESENFIAEAE